MTQGDTTAHNPPFWRREIPRPWKHADPWAIIGIPGVALFLFHRAVFGQGFFYQRDIHLVWLPQVEAFVRSVLSGSWPVWDPSSGFGQPLWADPSAQVLYPWTWLNLVLRPWVYYTLFGVGHVVLSGWATYALARRWEVSRGGSLLAAILWGSSGPYLSLVNLWHHFAGASWIPLVLLAADLALKAPRTTGALLWGGAMAGQILAGSADMVAMTIVVTLAYAGRRWLATRSLGVPLVAGGAYATALGLSAALWIPAFAVVSRSIRSDLPETVRAYWSLHPVATLEALFPVSLSALPLRPEIREALFESREPFLASVYLGLATVGFVVAALGPSPRKRPAAFLWLVFGFAVLMALGRHSPVYRLAADMLPPLRILRYPVKAMALAALSWALLAGIGFDAWREEGGLRPRRWRTIAGVLFALAVIAAGTAWLMHSRPGTLGPFLLDLTGKGDSSTRALAPVIRNLATAGLLAGVAACVALWRLWQPTAARRSALVLAILAGGDVLFYHRHLHSLAPRELFTTRPPVLESLADAPEPRLYVYDYSLLDKRRVYLASGLQLALMPQGWTLDQAMALAQQMALTPATPGRWGLLGSYDIDYRGLYPQELSRMSLLLRAVEGTPAHLRLLQCGGVTHVIALHRQGFEDLSLRSLEPGLYKQPIYVYRVPKPLPRTYAVGRVRVADGSGTLEALLDPGFDPAAEIVVPHGQPSDAGPTFVGESRVTKQRPDRVELQAWLSQPGYVVLLDSFDPGWQVRVDQRIGKLLRANGAFRAVEVGAGRHVIEFLYRPSSVWLGIAVSTATLAVGAILVLSSVRRA